jgi:2-C-methyl-D-erythritol 4-phosphate cytidylyltransferase
MNKTTAILLAAGKSERLGKMIPKPYLQLGGKPIYRYSLDVFLAHAQIDAISIVVPKHLLLAEQKKINREIFPKPIQLIEGGESRFKSVYSALYQLDNDIKNVLIHDAARPFINTELIDDCLKNLHHNQAVSCAIESTDTLVSGASNTQAEFYLDRNKIMRIQTPQVFHIDILKKAYSLALKENKTNFTDDSSMINYYKLAPVFLVLGDIKNIKITHPSDLLLAEHILQKKKL